MTRGLHDHGVKVGFNVYLPQIRITWVGDLHGCLVGVGRPILIVRGTFCQQPRRERVADTLSEERWSTGHFLSPCF